MERLSRWLKKYFIPHGENNYKPHFLRHESMLLVFFVVIIIELGFLVQVFIIFDKTNFLAAVLPGVLTTLTNEERAQNNVGPLVQNDLLTQAAQLKAEDMATHEYFAHTSPDGKTPWYWFNQVGYSYSSAGENLAVNFFESDDVARAWMNSPTHRANIVKENYTEIGIGVASGTYEGKSTVFVAQLFGTPIKSFIPESAGEVAVLTTEIKPKIPVTAPQPAGEPIRPPAETTPVVTPPTVVTVAPVAVQILGEETSPTLVKNVAPQYQIKSFIQKILASPREYVTYIYGGILLLIVLALSLVVLIRNKMTHPLIIARGAALVAVIFLLLFVNIKVLHLDTKVPTEGLSASVITTYNIR